MKLDEEQMNYFIDLTNPDGDFAHRGLNAILRDTYTDILTKSPSIMRAWMQNMMRNIKNTLIRGHQI